MTWQPIETAPKDGTPILLWDEEAQLEADWRDPRWGFDALDGNFPPPFPFVGYWDGKSWKLGHYSAFVYSPTKWAPLPELPR